MANEYEAVSGIYTEQIASLHDVFKPQHETQLKAPYGDQFMSSMGWLRAMSREKPVEAGSITVHEEDWIHREINVDSVTSSATDKAEVTLASGDHDSNGNSYPREGDIVMTNDEVPARIMSKDTSSPQAHVLSLDAIDDGDDISGISGGDVLIINNGAYGNGTDQPPGTVSGTRQFTYYLQTFKETVGAEGSELVHERWYKVKDQNGNIGFFSPDSVTRAEALLDRKIEGAFAFGKEKSNADMVVPSGSAGAGNDIQTTKGMVPHIRSRGKTISITPGAFDLDDAYTLKNYLVSQGITSGYVLHLTGEELADDINDAAFDKLDTNGTDYTRAAKAMIGEVEGMEALAMAINFKVLTIGSITLIIRSMPHWSDPKSYGATGFNFNQYGLAIPMTKFVNPSDNTTWDNLTTRYRANNAYSRRREIWRNGAAGGNQRYIGSIDKTNTYVRSEIGLQFSKANQSAIMDPA